MVVWKVQAQATRDLWIGYVSRCKLVQSTCIMPATMHMYVLRSPECSQLTGHHQYTLEILKSMAGGNALDVQRDERWPNKSDGVKVKFQSWEEKTDSEDDGTYPPGTTFDKGVDDVDEDEDDIVL